MKINLPTLPAYVAVALGYLVAVLQPFNTVHAFNSSLCFFEVLEQVGCAAVFVWYGYFADFTTGRELKVIQKGEAKPFPNEPGLGLFYFLFFLNKLYPHWSPDANIFTHAFN